MAHILNYTTRWADRDIVTFVALTTWQPGDEKEIVGTVMLDFHGDRKKECLLWNLHVTSAARKKGLGKRLLEAAMDFASERGMKEIYLEWSARDTSGWVLDWYKRQGFKVGRGYHDTVKLVKILKK